MLDIKLLAATAAIAITPFAASANILNFAFEGFVESTNDGGNNDVAWIGELNVGDFVSGSFVLDTSLLTGGSGTSLIVAGAISNFALTIDGFSYLSADTGAATLHDNHMAGTSAPERDMFIANVTSGVMGPAQVGLDPARMQFSIGGTDAIGVLSGLNVPTIAQFLDLFNNDNNNGNTKFLSFSDGSDVRYDLTSLTVTTSEVPLPAGLPLMLAGLAAFGLARRKSA